MTELEFKIISQISARGHISGQVPGLYVAPTPNLQPEIDLIETMIGSRRLWYQTKCGMLYGTPPHPYIPRNPATGRAVSGFLWLTPAIFEEAKAELWAVFNATQPAQPSTNVHNRFGGQIITRQQWETFMAEEAATGASASLKAFRHTIHLLRRRVERAVEREYARTHQA